MSLSKEKKYIVLDFKNGGNPCQDKRYVRTYLKRYLGKLPVC